MRVLVTRAKPGAWRTEKLLRARGHDPVLAPVLDIKFLTPASLYDKPPQAFLFTSPHGVLACARLGAPRDMAVYAVGDGTASVAREQGFSRVESADGNEAALVAFIEKKLDPDKGVLVHVCGTHLAGDLVGDLQKKGFSAQRRMAYRASPIEKLPDTIIQFLETHALDAILFHSPRGAQVFSMLVEAQGLLSSCKTLGAVVMSKTVKESLKPAFASLHVAHYPCETALMEALDTIALEKNPNRL